MRIEPFTAFDLVFRSFLIPLILIAPSVAATEENGTDKNNLWTPECVPIDHWDDFFSFFQAFLQENPFQSKREKPKTEEEKREKNENLRRLADLEERLSEVLAKYSRSELFPESVSPEIKKERSKKIHGSWNLYQNIPLNNVDLWIESCHWKFRSLLHEAERDAEFLGDLHLYADRLAEYPALKELHRSAKRTACLASLRGVREPLRDDDDHETEEKKTLHFPTLAEELAEATRLFADFLRLDPVEENLKTVEVFLDTIDRLRDKSAGQLDETALQRSSEALRPVLSEIREHTENPLIREYAGVFLGVLRRQELLDKPMPIWGATPEGKHFDEKTLEGKVILLDFWATWCGPCVAEFPHLKTLYDKYKEKGFEIVAYSIDADREKLRDYLEQNPLPWIVLSKEATREGGLPALSEYYGAQRVPVVLLRGRDGNAVHLKARGEELDAMLEKLFIGPPIKFEGAAPARNVAEPGEP